MHDLENGGRDRGVLLGTNRDRGVVIPSTKLEEIAPRCPESGVQPPGVRGLEGWGAGRSKRTIATRLLNTNPTQPRGALAGTSGSAAEATSVTDSISSGAIASGERLWYRSSGAVSGDDLSRWAHAWAAAVAGLGGQAPS